MRCIACLSVQELIKRICLWGRREMSGWDLLQMELGSLQMGSISFLSSWSPVLRGNAGAQPAVLSCGTQAHSNACTQFLYACADSLTGFSGGTAPVMHCFAKTEPISSVGMNRAGLVCLGDPPWGCQGHHNEYQGMHFFQGFWNCGSRSSGVLWSSQGRFVYVHQGLN